VKPDRIGNDVQRELARFGPAEGMSEIVRAWTGAVGDQIALNSWPARLSRDRTLYVATSSSAWAFELAQLEPKLLERLREELDDHAPAALRFAPGKLPERSSEEIESRPRRGREPTAEERELATALAAGIEDEGLRKVVAKAALASLARAD
jgi:predicted nucleic acid-binding Zn ribbon protein